MDGWMGGWSVQTQFNRENIKGSEVTQRNVQCRAMIILK